MDVNDNNNVSLDTLLNEAAGNTAQNTPPADAAPSTETTEQTPATDDNTNTNDNANDNTDSNTSTNTDDNTQSQQPSTDDKQNEKKNPMKEVRDKLNAEQKAREKVEKAMQRYTEGSYKFSIRDFKTEDGKVDYDAFIKAMDDEDTKVKAESRGVTPEVQAEIDRIEKEKIELQKERLKVSMDRAISNLQIDMNLDKTAVNKFFADALAVQKNPYQWLAQGGALPDLYYLIYRETLTKAAIDKAVADAKASWEKLNNVKAPTTNPAATATDSGGNNGISMEDLLNEAANKKK